MTSQVTCIHCAARFDWEMQIFIDIHEPSCPLYEPELTVRDNTKRAHTRVDNRDRKHLFSDAWPGRWPGYDGEYRFAREHVGAGPGIRKRFRTAGLHDWRFDFAWPAHMVAVEVDGNAWGVKGGGSHMQDKDLKKLNHAKAWGWMVFRFSPGMLREDPMGCVEMVYKAIEKRGQSHE